MVALTEAVPTLNVASLFTTPFPSSSTNLTVTLDFRYSLEYWIDEIVERTSRPERLDWPPY